MSESNSQIDQAEFDKLFIRSDGFNHLLLSDVQKLTKMIGEEFKEVVTVRSIGKSANGKDINVIELDATAMFAQSGSQTTEA
jgi:hypothetical protein